MPAQGKKRKGYYIQAARGKVARKANDLRSGCKGFLITCNNGKSRAREATMEAYRVLNEYADLKYGPEKSEVENEDDEKEDMNLEDALQKEVADIKQSNSKDAVRRFKRLNCKLDNTIFIQTELADPAELVNVIFEDILSTQVRKTKQCLRFLPVTRTCYAGKEEIIKTVKEICKPIFVEQTEEKLIRFCFLWKVTANSSHLSRDEVIKDEICPYVFSKHQHTTDYTDPEVAINIQVVGNTCCISVLDNLLKFRKYNIDAIVNKPKAENGEGEEAKKVVCTPDDAKKESSECCDDTTIKSDTIKVEKSECFDGTNPVDMVKVERSEAIETSELNGVVKENKVKEELLVETSETIPTEVVLNVVAAES